MLHALVLPDSIAGRVEARPTAFVCSSSLPRRDTVWVHVSGELDIVTTPRLQRVLRECQMQARVVVLDLRELLFMDSSGVHAIVDASVHARGIGRRLVLLRSRPDVHRIFGLTGSSAEVENGYVDAMDPVQALLRRPEEEASP
jgi:anti-sigma B factor antagonist